MYKIETKFAGFDWDDGNRGKNAAKHGVNCWEAEEVFKNDPIVIPDDQHSTAAEERHVALGETVVGILLTVVFTVRIDKIRVISARPMSRHERSFYEAQKEKDND